MTSLLQFSGQISRKGVRLEFMLVTKRKPDYKDLDGTIKPGLPAEYEMIDSVCPHCGQEHEALYVAWRKPAGRWGHWVVFRYLGEHHVPDLSVPIAVDEAPRGARRLSDKEAFDAWHK